jgi:hypothetical protein
MTIPARNPPSCWIFSFIARISIEDGVVEEDIELSFKE